jgi:hypothetical protein
VLLSSYYYLTGPLIALCALGVIILICRWVFSPGDRTSPGAPRYDGDFGLLVPVATVRTRDDSQLLRELLRAEGIRSTVSAVDGGYGVLVFRADAPRARDLVRS